MKSTIQIVWFDYIKGYDLDRNPDNIGGKEIANWLSDDIIDVDWAEREIKELQSAKSGLEYSRTGNAHELATAGNLVRIRSSHDANFAALMTVEQTITALQNYIEYLKERARNRDRRPRSFDVEYEAEGEEVARKFAPRD